MHHRQRGVNPGTGFHRIPGPLFDMWLEQMEQTQLEIALEQSRRQYEEDLDRKRNEIDLRALEEICLDLEDLENNKQCAICFEDQRCGDLAIRLKCGHCFHRDCCIPWFRKRSTCPVCRLNLSEQENSTSMTDQERHERERFQQKLEQKRLERLAKLEEQRQRVLETNDILNEGTIRPQHQDLRSSFPLGAGADNSVLENSTTINDVSSERQFTERSVLAEHLRQAPVKKLKSILRQFGLDAQAQSVVEKQELIEMVLDATDRNKLSTLGKSELIERLEFVHADKKAILQCDDLSELLSRLSLTMLRGEL